MRARRERPLGEGKHDNLYRDMHAAMRGRGAAVDAGAAARAVEDGARLVAAPPGAPPAGASSPAPAEPLAGPGGPPHDGRDGEPPRAAASAADAGAAAGAAGADDRAADAREPEPGGAPAGAAHGGGAEEGPEAEAPAADGLGVVLQMPRGNLETVRPRALVLPAVAAALDVRGPSGAPLLRAAPLCRAPVCCDSAGAAATPARRHRLGSLRRDAPQRALPGMHAALRAGHAVTGIRAQ